MPRLDVLLLGLEGEGLQCGGGRDAGEVLRHVLTEEFLDAVALVGVGAGRFHHVPERGEESFRVAYIRRLIRLRARMTRRSDMSWAEDSAPAMDPIAVVNWAPTISLTCLSPFSPWRKSLK